VSRRKLPVLFARTPALNRVGRKGEEALKELLQRILGPLGLRVIRTTRITKADLFDHVISLSFSPSTVIDVGVGRGTPELYEPFPNSTFLLVEPVVEFEPFLREICGKYSADYIIAAAGDNTGDIVLNVPQQTEGALEGSSIYDHGGGYSPRVVPQITLDQVCVERNLAGPYLVKLDVQGAELEVLNGASKLLASTELVILESNLFEFHPGVPQFHDVVHYMKARGFVLYDIADPNYRPLDRALGQLDTAFVKENGLFRRHHAWR
jgi:FkbM family methyltransferase